MSELLSNTLNLAVLDPKQKQSTYSYQEAVRFRESTIAFALILGIDLTVNIISCENHQEVIDKMQDTPNTIALQPIINTSTGLVPITAYEPMKKLINQLKFYAGADLLIENRLIRLNLKEIFIDEIVIDLLDPVNFKNIQYILTHKAPLGQCKGKIEEINAKNPNLKIVDDFESTSEAVAALKSGTWRNAVAIGNMATAQKLDLEYTNEPWQDYPSDNFTTFLAVGVSQNMDSDLEALLDEFTKKYQESTNVQNFIINLPSMDEIGSLETFLNDLYNKFEVDLNYIKVKCEEENDSNQVKPYFSGTVATNQVEALKAHLQSKNTNLCIFYPKINLDTEIEITNNPSIDFVGFFDFELKINSSTGAISAKVPNRPGGLSDLLALIKKEGIALVSLEVFARGCEPYAILEGFTKHLN